MKHLWLLAVSLFSVFTMHAAQYDLIIRNGTVYDGSGKRPVVRQAAASSSSARAQTISVSTGATASL